MSLANRPAAADLPHRTGAEARGQWPTLTGWAQDHPGRRGQRREPRRILSMFHKHPGAAPA